MYGGPAAFQSGSLTSVSILPNIRPMLWKVLLNSFSALIRSIKVMFHQMVGLVFLLLGLSVAGAAWREYRQLNAEVPSSAFRFYGTVGFALVLLLFAASSFFKALSVRRKD